MPQSSEQPPLEDFATLQELTRKRRSLIEHARTGAESPEEADAALDEAESLSSLLRQKREAISEKLWPFPEVSRHTLETQYHQEREALRTAKVLERLSSGEEGIRGINGLEYPLPSFPEVVERLRENKEIVDMKMKQGLLRIQLTPIAMSLDSLRERYQETLLKHYVDMVDPSEPTKGIPDPTRTKLFATKENPTDPNEPLELDTNKPLLRYDEYVGGDVNNKLVYFPTQFNQQNHGGKTKSELIAQSGAWHIILTEDNPILPARGQGKDIGGRKQLEAGKSSIDYLRELSTNPMYQHEQGITTEDWLTMAIIRLETTNQVLDDWQGTGKASRNVGQYFPASGDVPDASWTWDDRQALLNMDDPAFSDDDIAVRSAVRV